eukprot:Amastigsp_a515657_20.p4 type:complete len:147 gc:universal Amastigsp_a515657_20:318-758(+)
MLASFLCRTFCAGCSRACSVTRSPRTARSGQSTSPSCRPRAKSFWTRWPSPRSALTSILFSTRASRTRRRSARSSETTLFPRRRARTHLGAAPRTASLCSTPTGAFISSSRSPTSCDGLPRTSRTCPSSSTRTTSTSSGSSRASAP